nr:unnamed protein product [Naegleria fowleri]
MGMKNMLQKAQIDYTENLHRVNEELKKEMERTSDYNLQFSKEGIRQLESRLDKEIVTVKEDQKIIENSIRQSLESSSSTLASLIDSSLSQIQQAKSDLQNQIHLLSSSLTDLSQMSQEGLSKYNEKFTNLCSELRKDSDNLSNGLAETRKSFESKTEELTCTIQTNMEQMNEKLEKTRITSLEIVEQKSKTLEEGIRQNEEKLNIHTEKLQKMKRKSKQNHNELLQMVSELRLKTENYNMENQGLKTSMAKLEDLLTRINDSSREEIKRINITLEKVGSDAKSLQEYTKKRVKKFKSMFESIRADNLQMDQATTQKIEDILSTISHLATKQELSSTESLYLKEIKMIEEKFSNKIELTEGHIITSSGDLQNKIEEMHSRLTGLIEDKTAQNMNQVLKFENDLKDTFKKETDKLQSNLQLDIQEKISSIYQKMNIDAANVKNDIQTLETKLKQELTAMDAKQMHDIQNNEIKQRQEIQNLEDIYKQELKNNEAKQSQELKALEAKVYEKLDSSENEIKSLVLSAKQRVEEYNALLRDEIDWNAQTLKNEITLHDSKVNLQIKSEVDTLEKSMKMEQQKKIKEILDKTEQETTKLKQDLQNVERKGFQELESLEMRFKQELTTIREKQTEDILSLEIKYKQEMGSLSQSFTNSLQSMETKFEEKLDVFNQTISKIDEKCEQVTVDAQSNLNSEIEKLKRKLDEQYLRMEQNFKDKTAETESTVNDMRIEMQTTISEVRENIRSEISTQKQEIHTQAAKHQQDIESIASKQIQEMESFELKIKHDLKSLKESCQRDMRQIEDKYIQALNSMEAAINQQVESTNKSVTEINNSLMKEVVKHEHLLNTEQKLESHLNVLREDFELIRNTTHHHFDLFNEKIENITRFESKQEQINKDIVMRAELLQVQQQVDSTLELLNKGIDAVAKSLNDLKLTISSVEETNINNINKIEQHNSSIEELHEKLNKQAANSALQDQTLQEKLNIVDQKLNNEINVVQTSTKDGLTNVETKMKQSILHLESQMSDQISKIQSSLENIKERSQHEINQIDIRLMDVLKQECSKLATKDVELETRLEIIHQNMHSDNELNNKSLMAIRNKIDATISEIDMMGQELKKGISQCRSALTNVEKTISEIKAELQENDREDEETKKELTLFKEHQSSVNSSHLSQISEMKELISEKENTMEGKLETIKASLLDHLKEYSSALPILKTSIEKLENEQCDLSNLTAHSHQSLQDMLNEKNNNMYQSIKALSEVVELENKNNVEAICELKCCNDKIEQQFVQVEETMKQRISAMKGSIIDEISQTISLIKEGITQLEAKSATSIGVRQQMENIELKLNDAKESLRLQQEISNSTMQNKITEIKEMLASHIDESLLQMKDLDQKTSLNIDTIKKEQMDALNIVEQKMNNNVCSEMEKIQNLISTCSHLSQQNEDFRSQITVLQNLIENMKLEILENENRTDSFSKHSQHQFDNINQHVQDLLLKLNDNSDLISKQMTELKEEVEVRHTALQEVSKSSLERLSICFTKLNCLNDTYFEWKKEVKEQLESLMKLMEDSERKKLEKLQSVLLSSNVSNTQQ